MRFNDDFIELAQVLKFARDTYDSLFEEEFLLLDKYDDFFDLCVRLGFIDVYSSFVNLLLLYGQCPDVEAIYPEQYILNKRINVLPDQDPVKLVRFNDTDKKYYVQSVYDARQTDAAYHPVIVTPTTDEAYKCLMESLMLTNTEIFNMNPQAVRWRDWAIVQFDGNKGKYVALIRQPDSEEQTKYTEEQIKQFVFRDIVKGLAYKYYSNPDNEVSYWSSAEGQNDKYEALCCFATDFVVSFCKFCGNTHYLSVMPNEINGSKPSLEDMEKLFSSGLKFYSYFFSSYFVPLLREEQQPRLRNSRYFGRLVQE